MFCSWTFHTRFSQQPIQSIVPHIFHKCNKRVMPILKCPPAFTYCHLYCLSDIRVSTLVLAPFSISSSATRVYMGIACLILLLNQLLCFHGVKSFLRSRSSDSQTFSRILWNPEIYYCLRKCPPLVSNLSQISPMHASPSLFFKITAATKKHQLVQVA
jgi:hypothetical protein